MPSATAPSEPDNGTVLSMFVPARILNLRIQYACGDNGGRVSTRLGAKMAKMEDGRACRRWASPCRCYICASTPIPQSSTHICLYIRTRTLVEEHGRWDLNRLSEQCQAQYHANGRRRATAGGVFRSGGRLARGARHSSCGGLPEFAVCRLVCRGRLVGSEAIFVKYVRPAQGARYS